MANGDNAFDTGNPAGFIRSAISGELNQTEAYDAFHSFGGHMQESRFNELFQQTAATYARQSDVLGLDPFQVPGPADYAEWSTSRPGMYATQVEVTLYDKDLAEAGVDSPWLTLQHTYMSDTPHTPAEAEQDAIDNFDPENTGSPPFMNQVMMGAVAVHLWKTV